MTSSKLFLAATTFILANAGVAASKASKYGTSRIRHYCTKSSSIPQGNHLCRSRMSICTNSGSWTCFFTFQSGSSSTQYTLYSNGLLMPILKCNPGSPQICTTPIKYFTEYN